MSSSGITPINSGPIILRTCLNSSSKTIVLTDYDKPVSSNRVLITSTDGLLAPSDNIYVSSISSNTLRSSTINASTINFNTISSFKRLCAHIIFSIIDMGFIVTYYMILAQIK